MNLPEVVPADCGGGAGYIVLAQDKLRLYTPSQTCSCVMLYILVSYFQCSGPRFLVVTTNAPDQDFLLNYVYGVMGAGMQKFHAFSHFANDGLSEVIEPRSLKDLASLCEIGFVGTTPFAFSLAPSPLPPWPISAHENHKNHISKLLSLLRYNL